MDPRQQVLRQINEAVSSIRNECELSPEIGVILGSGLAGFADEMEAAIAVDYGKISHFPVSTVQGHPGKLILGKFASRNLAVLQGRFHFYEGYTMWGITFAVRVLAMLGVKVLVVSGACGSLRDDYKQGELVLLTDHLNLMPANPLIGPHVAEMGRRFVDMSEPYDRPLADKAKEAAKADNITLKTGVYAAVAGPNYETGAETVMLKNLGADVVGMSIVPEVIVARQMGLKVLGIAVVSNEHGVNKKITHKEVLENVSQSTGNFVKLLQAIFK